MKASVRVSEFFVINMAEFFGGREVIGHKKERVAQALPYKGNPTYTNLIHISTLYEMSRIIFKN
jgi:hypothetical protein